MPMALTLSSCTHFEVPNVPDGLKRGGSLPDSEVQILWGVQRPTKLGKAS